MYAYIIYLCISKGIALYLYILAALVGKRTLLHLPCLRTARGGAGRRAFTPPRCGWRAAQLRGTRRRVESSGDPAHSDTLLPALTSNTVIHTTSAFPTTTTRTTSTYNNTTTMLNNNMENSPRNVESSEQKVSPSHTTDRTKKLICDDPIPGSG